MYSVLRLMYTHSRKSQLTLQMDWTGFHASRLVNNAGKVNRMRVSFSILNNAKLFNLFWLIDARRYVKINFSLLNDVSQEIKGYITQRNAKCYATE